MLMVNIVLFFCKKKIFTPNMIIYFNTYICLYILGTVTLWSPNMSTPLVKMLTHKGPVMSLAVDNTGR